MQFAIDSAKRNYLLRTNITNNREQEQPKTQFVIQTKKEAMLDKSAAFLAGAAIAGIVRNLKQANSQFFLSSLERINYLPSSEKTNYVAHKVIEDMGLSHRGISIIFAEDTPDSQKKVSNILSKNYFGAVKKKMKKSSLGFLDKISDILADANATLIGKSKKASYLIHEKCAITSKATSQLIFHELGHAKIAENKNLRPLLTVGKKLPICAVGLGAWSLWHTPMKKDDTVKKSSSQKIKDFVDGNIGKITFLSFAPLLVEKALATKYSLELTQKYLKPQAQKSLKKLYAIGLMTYVATAFASAAGFGLGNKVQNNIIKQKHTPQDVYNLLI